jgi:CBS domain-containing protein
MEANEVRDSHTDQEEAARSVGDIMRGRPKTLPVTTSVSELRGFFTNPHVMTALIVDEQGALLGVIERDELAAGDLSEGAPIEGLIRREVDAIDVRAPASEVWKHADLTRTGRLVVLEPDGKTLAGLVCARPNGGGFCR